MAEIFGAIIRPQEKKAAPKITVPEECRHLDLDKKQAQLLFGPLAEVPMSRSLARALSGYASLYQVWQATDSWQDVQKKWNIRKAAHGGAVEELDILFDKAGLSEEAEQIAS